MNIEYIKIFNINIQIIFLFILLAILIFLFSFYALFSKRLKINVLFDVGFMLIFSSFFFARLFGVINDFQDFQSRGWMILPIKDVAGKTVFAHALPWEFLDIFDSNLVLIGFPIGILLGGVGIYFLSNKKLNLLELLDKLVLAIIPMQIVMLVGAVISQLYFGKSSGVINMFITSGNQERSSIAFIELITIFIFLLFIMIFSLLYKKKGFILSSYLIVQGIISFFLLSKAEQVTNVMFAEVLGVVLFTVGVVLLFQTLIHSFYKIYRPNKEPQKRHTDFIEQTAYSDLDIHQKSISEKIKGFFKK